jgi:molybdopterin-dependent oxidoreductase alpha subunit
VIESGYDRTVDETQPKLAPAVKVTKPKRWASGVPAIASSIAKTVGPMGARRAAESMLVINQPEGFDCPGCAWPEAQPAERHAVEFCESGAKAVAEEGTRARVGQAFFAEHSVEFLRGQTDHWLGKQGRLCEPAIRRPESTHYEPISWTRAFDEITVHLRGLKDPNQAVFYTSGRTANEAAFVYQLFARSFGTNNLPDCSNMCHEPTSFALEAAIGIGKGSAKLEDFELADLIIVAGQNPGSNHPRMLTTLEAAKRVGAKIIAINPLPEAGLLRFKNPQRVRGVVGNGTELADLHLPIALGGDHALFQLFNSWILARDRDGGDCIDTDFVQRYTQGFPALDLHLAETDETALIEETGLSRAQLLQAFEMVVASERLIVCWAMGITQHLEAMSTIREITNLVLLGGHMGRPGTGLSPIRGHSNVQGDRTMGIFERPKPELLDALDAHFAIQTPRAHGLDTVDAVRAFDNGSATVLVSLGGNFVRATPDTAFTEAALGRAGLSVQISTKLNRTHLIAGETAIILPVGLIVTSPSSVSST